MAGWWAAILAIELPFIRRKSFIRRVADRMPDVSMPSMSDVRKMSGIRNMPWNKQPSRLERLTMAEQRRAARERFAKASSKVISRAEDQRKQTVKQAAKVASRAQDRSKEALKAVSKNIPSKQETKDRIDKSQVVVRSQSFIEKLPFGERRETIIEKVPLKK